MKQDLLHTTYVQWEGMLFVCQSDLKVQNRISSDTWCLLALKQGVFLARQIYSIAIYDVTSVVLISLQTTIWMMIDLVNVSEYITINIFTSFNYHLNSCFKWIRILVLYDILFWHHEWNINK